MAPIKIIYDANSDPSQIWLVIYCVSGSLLYDPAAVFITISNK